MLRTYVPPWPRANGRIAGRSWEQGWATGAAGSPEAGSQAMRASDRGLPCRANGSGSYQRQAGVAFNIWIWALTEPTVRTRSGIGLSPAFAGVAAAAFAGVAASTDGMWAGVRALGSDAYWQGQGSR